MIKLETDVYYLVECEACKERAKYLMRGENLNTGITDKDVITIADNNLGTYTNSICEYCELYSRHKTIGYRWKEVK